MQMTDRDIGEEKLLFNYHKMDELSSHLVHGLSDLENITDPDAICNKIINAYNLGITKYSYKYRPNRKK